MKYLAAMAAIGALLAGPASAQSGSALFTGADMDAMVPPIDHDCIMGAAKTVTPEQKIANCTAALADLDALAKKAKTPARKAGINFLIATFDFARTGGYLKVDTVRSKRVCEGTERAYALIAPINAALFDVAGADALNQSRAAMSNSARVCRQDFGVPKGAPALIAN